MQARYYDPNIGRFLSVDPVGFLEDGRAGMFNRYSYTLNDPVNMIDPNGMYTTCTAYKEDGGNQACTEVQGVTGEKFASEKDAVEALGDTMNKMSSTENFVAGYAPEFGAAVSTETTSDGNTVFVPTIIVSDGDPNGINMNQLLNGTDNVSTSIHSHGNSIRSSDNNFSRGDLSNANRRAIESGIKSSHVTVPMGYIHKYTPDISRPNTVGKVEHSVITVRPSNSAHPDPRPRHKRVYK